MNNRTIISVSVTILIVMFFISIPVVLDTYRVAHFKRKAASIHVGDSISDVRRTLGKPSGEFEQRECFLSNVAGLSKKLPPAYAYGSDFDWKNSLSSEFPFFFPFAIRLFGPHSNDVMIEFDNKGKISSIRIPK